MDMFPRQALIMIAKRRVEVFTAGCRVSNETVQMILRIACGSCEVAVRDLSQEPATKRAESLGIRCVPAVVIDGELASCCEGTGVREAALVHAGIGQSR